MTQVLAYPLRLSGENSLATVDDETEAFFAQEIALLVLTEPGERPLVPDFGLDSAEAPTAVDELELVLKCDLFDVPVKIKNVAKAYGDELTRVTVEFELVEDDSMDIGTSFATTEDPDAYQSEPLYEDSFFAEQDTVETE